MFLIFLTIFYLFNGLTNFLLLFLLFRLFDGRFSSYQSDFPLITDDLINQGDDYFGKDEQLEEQQLNILELPIEDEIAMQADEKNIR